MLNRLESVYLSILRVVILIAATLALLVAVLGVASAVPLLLERAGFTSGDESATLADFMADKKAVPGEEPLAESSVPDAVHPDLAAAARNVHQYLAGRSSYSVQHWEEVLTAYWQEVPAEADDEYASSVRELSEELLEATGRPLSLEQVEELLLWHFQRYMANLENRAAQQAAADAQFLLAIGGAASAFVIFVFIVFIFLFVKIERSLRVVRTTRVQEEGYPDEAFDA